MAVHRSGGGPIQKIVVDVEADADGSVAPVRLPPFAGCLLGMRKVGPACSVKLLSGPFDFAHGVGEDLERGRCAVLITEVTAPGVHPEVDEGDELDLTITSDTPRPHGVYRVEVLFGVDRVEEVLFIATERT